MADSLKIKVNIDFNHLNSELAKLKNKVQSTDITIGSKNLNDSMKSISKNSKEAAKGFDLFNTSIVNAISKFSQWYLIGKLISGTFRLIASGVNDIYLLDKAMTNISYTMDLTEQQFEGLKNKSFEFAESLNTSVHKVMEANQIFANLNETIESVNLKTETTIALANLTGASISEMADVLQGLIFQFGLSSENAGDLGDALVSIAATTGVEFKRSILNMSQAVARAGSVAADAGFQYNEFLATIATLNEQSRLAGSTLAAGLTTILSRLTRVSDASAEEISKVETALNKVGVRLRDGNGEFRDSFDVLYDLSKVYKQLTSVQQAELGYLIAGTRQRKVFNTLMESFPQIIKRSELALNSEGKIMELNDKKARSFEGAIDDLKNSLESLFDTIFKSDTFISIINFFTKLIDFTQQAIENIDILAASVTGLGTAIIGFKSAALATTGASATLAGAGAIGVLGLSAPVIFGITAAITALTSAYVVYRKRVIEAKEVAAKFKEEQKVINDLIQNGNERELKIRINKLKELKRKYEEVIKKQKEFQKQNYISPTVGKGEYSNYVMSVQKYKNKRKEIENEFKKYGTTVDRVDKDLYELENRLKRVTVEFDETGRTLRDLTQAYTNFENKLDSGLDNLKNINSALQDVSENEEYNKESIIRLAKTYPQLLGVLNDRGELEKTLIKIKNEQLEQTKLSLQNEVEALERSLEAKAKIYGLEVQMIDTVNQTRLDFVRQKLSQVQGTIGLTRAQSQLEELYDTAKKVRDAKRFLNNFEVNVSNIGFKKSFKSTFKKSSKSTKDNLIQLSDTYLIFTENIEALNQQIEKNKLLLEDENLSNQDKIRILNEQQQKYKQLQSALRALNSERVKERSKIKEQIKNLVEFNKAGEIIRYNQEKYTDKQANLIKQYQELGDAINRTKLEIISLDNEQINNLKVIKNINKEIEKLEREKISLIADIENEIVSLYKKNIEKKLNLLKQEYNEDLKKLEERHKRRTKLYEEDLREYESYINEKLKKLEDQYAEEDFLKNLQEEREKANEIQLKLNELALDNSLEAKVKRIELEKQLAEQEEKITELKNNRERDIRRNNLQEQLNDYKNHIKKLKRREYERYERIRNRLEREYEKHKETLERELENEKLYTKAREEIMSGNFENIMALFSEFQKNFSDGWSSLGDIIENEFLQKLKKAKKTLEEFKDIEYAKHPETKISSTSSNNIIAGVNDSKEYEVPATLPDGTKTTVIIKDGVTKDKEKLPKGTIIHTGGGDFEVKHEYEVPATLPDGTKTTVIIKDGVTKDKEKLPKGTIIHTGGGDFEVKHEGGFIGGKPLKPKHEKIVKALKGELFVPPKQLDKLYNNWFTPTINIPKTQLAGVGNITIDASINVEGNLDNSIVSKVTDKMDNNINKIINILNKNGKFATVRRTQF